MGFEVWVLGFGFGFGFGFGVWVWVLGFGVGLCWVNLCIYKDRDVVYFVASVLVWVWVHSPHI